MRWSHFKCQGHTSSIIAESSTCSVWILVIHTPSVELRLGSKPWLQKCLKPESFELNQLWSSIEDKPVESRDPMDPTLGWVPIKNLLRSLWGCKLLRSPFFWGKQHSTLNTHRVFLNECRMWANLTWVVLHAKEGVFFVTVSQASVFFGWSGLGRAKCRGHSRDFQHCHSAHERLPLLPCQQDALVTWLNVATGMKDLPAEARCRCLSSSLAGGFPFVQAPLQRHLNMQLVMTSDLKVEKIHGVFRKKKWVYGYRR